MLVRPGKRPTRPLVKKAVGGAAGKGAPLFGKGGSSNNDKEYRSLCSGRGIILQMSADSSLKAERKAWLKIYCKSRKRFMRIREIKCKKGE